MKSLLTTLLFTATFAALPVAFAAEPNKEVEPGYYEAIDATKGDVNVQMDVREDGTADVSIVTASPFKPDVDCSGQWYVEGNIFYASLECDSFLVPSIDVNIDITNVNPESVRSDRGAEVGVQLDIMGPEPRLFLLKKVEQIVQ